MLTTSPSLMIDKQQISILVLPPVTPTAGPNCILEHTRLYAISEFEALSHCWESDSKPQSIIFDNGAVHLTDNSSTALSPPTLLDSERRLWANVVPICINHSFSFAAAVMDIVATIPELLKVISEMGKRVTRNDSDDDDRAGLLSAARELVSALESPVERLSRMVYLEPTLLAIVRVAIDWLLYPAMLEDGGSSKSPAQLAQRCKVDIKLMSRALKHLAAGAIIKETDAARYAPTPMVSLLCSQGAQGMVIDMCVVPQIVSPAMRKGFSKILLNEIVIPDRGANWFCTSLDVLMMLAHAAQERTEGDWRVLLGKAGLEIARIWD
ncbi:S-adenosyl-L-methionine-dependent methyltransferase [Venturia nashicola]|nr:S-adenosyl-L-methionine-dependent methyltransferase [Venturia nashicola]